MLVFVFFVPKKSHLGYDYFVLEHPLEELLVINLLSSDGGLDVHSCGLLHEDGGIVFVGQSGAGKSTLAGLAKNRRDLTILSDDRVVIRRAGDQFNMYGTPWHGDTHVYSPQHGTLKKIFFIKHAKENYIKEIRRLETASRLMAQSFPVYWSRDGMQSTLGFVGDLVAKIPCYELGFVPDDKVIDLALETL